MSASSTSPLVAAQKIVAVIDTLNTTLINQDYIDNVFSRTSVLQISKAIVLTSNIVIPSGKTVSFVGEGAMNLHNHSIIWNGAIKAPRKVIFTWSGVSHDIKITGNPETEEWLCDWFGMIADGVTNYVQTGLAYALANFSSATKKTVVFTSGLFKTGFNNVKSDTTFRCEADCVWAGTVHAAVNNDGETKPHLNPRNVKWIGRITTLERVGTYHCDNVTIDEIYVKEDDANSLSGYAAGVHFYSGTKNLTCQKITVENSRSSFGVGIDSGVAAHLPTGVNINHIEVMACDVTGVYLRAKNTRINSINVRNYGTAELAEVNSIGLPYFKGDPTKTYGVVYESCENLSVGSVHVECTNYSFIASHAVELGAGTTSTEMMTIRGSANDGVSVRLGQHTISSIDSRLVKNNGVQVNAYADLTFTRITSSYNQNIGVYTAANALLSGKKIKVENNAFEGLFSVATQFAVNAVESINNRDGHYNVALTSPSGFISTIKTSRNVEATGGGVGISGNSSGFDCSVKLLNEGSANTYAMYINNAKNINLGRSQIYNSTNQALRLTTLDMCSLNGVNIIDSGKGSGVVALALTNVSFSNCVNEMSTNVGNVHVSEFNCVGMTF